MIGYTMFLLLASYEIYIEYVGFIIFFKLKSKENFSNFRTL